MPLSEKQLEKLYETTLENHTDIGWIRECLEKNNNTMVSLSKRQSIVEREQAILKGKLGAFVIVLSLSATLLFNSISLIIAKYLMG